jgi:hypothetical protein
LLLVCLLAATVAWLVVRHDTGSGRARSAAAPTAPPPGAKNPSTPLTSAVDPATSQLLGWVRTNLSSSAVIVGDPETTAALRASGFRSATSYARSATAAPQTLDYLVVRPTRDAPTLPAESRLLSLSLPLAVAGSGASEASVRQIFGSGAAAAEAARAKDARLRRVGGAQLASNPAMVLDDSTRAALRAGRLDLRAQNVVNVLATGGRIWLSIGSEDPAEERAGLPARTVTVTAANGSAMQISLAALTPPYRPAGIVAVAPNKVRLSWTPQIAPVPVVD